MRVLALAIVVLCPALPAETPKRSDLLIDAASLAKRIAKSAPLDILDARSASDYARAHIPGAVLVDVNRWKALVFEKSGYTDAKSWATEVGKLGVDGTRSVVVYGTNPTSTARLWWTLKYLGVERVLYLDGGWAAWEKGKHPTSDKPITVKAAKFTPRFQKDRLATVGELKGALKSKSLVAIDARSEGECRSGKVPGAVHLEWKELLESDGRFKKAAEIRKLLTARGVEPGKPLVPY